MKRGLFITFEGCEGCGKSTQSLLLFNLLTSHGIAAVHTREPGGTSLAEKVRHILLDPESTISPMAELLLYEAARAQHADELIRPSLKAGKIVICDRYIDATLAYQGYGRKLDRQVIAQLNAIAARDAVPNLTICLDIPVEKGLERARSLKKDPFGGGQGDRLEREEISFHRRVRNGYRALARQFPRRIKILPTGATVESTHAAIMKIVTPVLARAGWKMQGAGRRAQAAAK